MFLLVTAYEWQGRPRAVGQLAGQMPGEHERFLRVLGMPTKEEECCDAAGRATREDIDHQQPFHTVVLLKSAASRSAGRVKHFARSSSGWGRLGQDEIDDPAGDVTAGGPLNPRQDHELLTSSTMGPSLDGIMSTPAMLRPRDRACRPRSVRRGRQAGLGGAPPRCRLLNSPACARRDIAATTWPPTTMAR